MLGCAMCMCSLSTVTTRMAPALISVMMSRGAGGTVPPARSRWSSSTILYPCRNFTHRAGALAVAPSLGSPTQHPLNQYAPPPPPPHRHLQTACCPYLSPNPKPQSQAPLARPPPPVPPPLSSSPYLPVCIMRLKPFTCSISLEARAGHQPLQNGRAHRPSQERMRSVQDIGCACPKQCVRDSPSS
jgi:hypothetical protein